MLVSRSGEKKECVSEKKEQIKSHKRSGSKLTDSQQMTSSK